MKKKRTVKAAEFKAVCLRLMEQVRESGVEYVITKHGKPVATLGPVTEEHRSFVGRSRGVISVSREELMAPIGEDWELGTDL
jgi:prevent-host-death family protein